MRKKHWVRRLSAALLAAVLWIGTACSDKPPAENAEEPTVTPAATETLPPLTDRLAEYTLVRPDLAEGSLLDVVLNFRLAIKETAGIEMPIQTDWVKRGEDPDAAGERELLFGLTNRTASIEAMAELTSFDYMIRTVGEDIVVLGGSDYALSQAAEQFIELLAAGLGELDYLYRYEDNKQEGDVMLRVASYNIRHGADVNMDMKVLADDITGLNIDVVGLQEIDQNAKRSGYIDTMKLLSEATGMEYYAFAKGVPLGSGEYGTGILSRWPIVAFEVTPLTSDDHEQRSIGHAILDVNGTYVHFFNTHLSYESKTTRTKQYAQVAELLPKGEPWILTGDFNTGDFTEFDVLGYGTLLNRADHRMASFFSSSSPIDNIVLSEGWAVMDDGMLEVPHSDHYMIWCDAYRGGETK